MKQLSTKQFTGDVAFKKLNTGCYWESNVFGQWRECLLKDESGLPFPVITAKPEGYNRKAFLRKLDDVSKKAKAVKTKKPNVHRWEESDDVIGGALLYKGCTWPNDYRQYIADGVIPSREFYNLVTGKDLDTLPSYVQHDSKKANSKKTVAVAQSKSTPAKKEKDSGKKSFTPDVVELGTIPVSDATQISVRINTVDGAKKLDIRAWYKTKQMTEFAPSPKGVSIDTKHLKKLRKMLSAAIELEE